MKNFKLVFLLFFMSSFCFSQMQDLEKLANGKIAFTDNLFDAEKNLIGYIYIFDQGDIDENTKQFEYVWLDKNLNKVSNGTFTEIRYNGLKDVFVDCIHLNDKVIIIKNFGINFMGVNYPSLSYLRSLNLDTKEVSPAYFSDNGAFKEVYFKDADEIKKYYKQNQLKTIIEGINVPGFSGFAVLEKTKLEHDEKELFVYDKDLNLKWSYAYNSNADKKNYKKLRIFGYNEALFLVGEESLVKGDMNEFSIIGLDTKTGQKLFTYPLENKESEFTHTLMTTIYGDKIYIVGNYSPNKGNGFNWEKNLGIYKIGLNKSGQEISKKYYQWLDIASDLKANKYGNVENGYFLSPKQFFVFKDGSFAHLTEKFKMNNNPFLGMSIPKATDMVVFKFDSEGVFKGNNLLDKAYSSWIINDYIFSQYVKDDTGVLFFFRDYKREEESKDKSWNLSINMLLNGEFKQESIKISPEVFDINVYPAKEGYILLQEIEDKEKFNQIRLEKINL